ncbi:hypothetical protein FEO86_09455 [Stenotrophomonas maltophilia]|nr:hypothetical protein FEO86_09455 [Stenotrophomonas maltophilia]
MVDTVDPRHAWMLFVQFSKCSISIEIHPRMAWIYDRSQETVEGGVGPVAGVSAAWARGMPRAGWAGRPTPVLPCAQDSAHEQAAAKPPRTGLRRLPQPDPPRHPTGNPLLPLLLPLRLRLPASGRHYRRRRAQPGRTPLNRQAAPGTGTLCRHQIANVT